MNITLKTVLVLTIVGLSSWYIHSLSQSEFKDYEPQIKGYTTLETSGLLQKLCGTQGWQVLEFNGNYVKLTCMDSRRYIINAHGVTELGVIQKQRTLFM